MKCTQLVITIFLNDSYASCAYEMTDQKPMPMSNVMESWFYSSSYSFCPYLFIHNLLYVSCVCSVCWYFGVMGFCDCEKSHCTMCALQLKRELSARKYVYRNTNTLAVVSVHLFRHHSFDIIMHIKLHNVNDGWFLLSTKYNHNG